MADRVRSRAGAAGVAACLLLASGAQASDADMLAEAWLGLATGTCMPAVESGLPAREHFSTEEMAARGLVALPQIDLPQHTVWSDSWQHETSGLEMIDFSALEHPGQTPMRGCAVSLPVTGVDDMDAFTRSFADHVDAWARDAAARDGWSEAPDCSEGPASRCREFSRPASGAPDHEYRVVVRFLDFFEAVSFDFTVIEQGFGTQGAPG